MPKLIVTSRYLKSGSGKKKQLYHYVKYIATREGSVPIPNANEKSAGAYFISAARFPRQQRVI